MCFHFVVHFGNPIVFMPYELFSSQFSGSFVAYRSLGTAFYFHVLSQLTLHCPMPPKQSCIDIQICAIAYQVNISLS